MQVSGYDTRLIARFDDNRAGTVTKQYTGISITPVKDAGKGFSANNKRPFCRPGPNEIIRDTKGINKPRTNSLDIKRSRPSNPKASLQETGSAGKNLIGGCCGNHNQIDITGLEICHLNSLTRGLFSQVTSEFVIGSDMAFTDTGATDYPFISGIDDLFKILVGECLFRQIPTSPRDTRKNHAISLFSR
jgi:hypothetical protein